MAIRYFSTGPFPVYFAVCFDGRAFAREMKRLGVDDPPEFVTSGAAATTHTLTSSSRMDTIILCLDPGAARGRAKEEIVGLFAHEATHCMQSTIEAMRDSEPSREMQAYLVQWFTQCAIAEFNRFRKAKK